MFHVEHVIKREDLTTEKAEEVRGLRQDHKMLLSEYIDKLMWWNKRINLVSRDVSRETITKHVEHSLVLSCSEEFKRGSYIIDTGTGGGLPGIPLAVTHPDKSIVLNDIVSKKIMACKHISSGLDLQNIQTSTGSIEGEEIPGGAVIVSKHAFKINDLIGLLGDNNWSSIILLKGGEEVGSELDGIKYTLNINIVDLEKGFADSFYSGKAMVEISKKK